MHFRHGPLAGVEDYTRYFGCPVRFTQPGTGFLFPRPVLARPLTADSAMHELAREYLNTIAVPADSQSSPPGGRLSTP